MMVLSALNNKKIIIIFIKNGFFLLTINMGSVEL